MMNLGKIVKQSIVVISVGLLFGCAGSSSLYSPKKEGLSQERLFLNDKAFVSTQVKPSISYPTSNERSTATEKGIGVFSVGSAIVGTIAPKLIESSIDLVAKSIVSLSGKNDQTRTIGSEVSSFFYKDENFNMSNDGTPALNILFVSAVFGESKNEWMPDALDFKQRHKFKALNIVGEPNFYLEAKVFPIPGNRYMEIVPTYMFYNKLLNSKGMDRKRDLAIDFSFYDLENKSASNLISKGSLIFRDVQVAKEYSEKELANVRTTFLEMPTISNDKRDYSGAYNLKVNITETRDVNEWLAALGESISSSSSEITSQLYVSKEERIRLKEALEKARIDLEIVELKIAEAKKSGMSESDILELKKELVEAQAELDKRALKRGNITGY